MKSNHLEQLINKRLRGRVLVRSSSSDTEERLLIDRRHLVAVISLLKSDADAQLDLLLDIVCMENAPQSTFEVKYTLRSSRLGYRLQLSLLLEDEDPFVNTLSPFYASAHWLERELWDFFGVYAEGHPNLTRLLLYPGFSGHPLKKSYPIDKDQALVPIYKG